MYSRICAVYNDVALAAGDDRFKVWPTDINVRRVVRGVRPLELRGRGARRGGNRIVALGEMHSRGRFTGVQAHIPLAVVFTVGEDGQLIRYESFRNTEEALRAVGLSE